MRQISRHILWVLFLYTPVISFSQLQVDSNITPFDLVNKVLLGPGVMAYNISYTGAGSAIGYFDGTNSNIGLDSGIILSSGKVTTAIGPNDQTDATSINFAAGDSELTAIAGQQTMDAAILEFDFIPSSDTVKFNYVFASEEYFEGVCTPYNDVFAFLISGPAIIGTQNIALIPSTNTAVSISSVNGGIIGLPIYNPDSNYPYCFLTNTQFYIDNTNPPGTSVQYDGFTTVFTAKSAVIPCAVYHIKMAIADGGYDNTWDSGVFLEAGSFNSHYITVDARPVITGTQVDSAMVEGCGEALINFRRYDSLAYPRTLNYTLAGTAVPGVDYSISSPNIYFPPGEDSVNIVVSPNFDTNEEGVETFKLTIVPDFIVCSAWDTAYAELKIIDEPPLSINSTTIKPDCPYDSIQLIASVQGGVESFYYDFTWNWQNETYTGDSISVLAGTGEVYLSAANPCSMQDATISQYVEYDCIPIVPNVFTPNGDGTNDYFTIPYIELFEGAQLHVYNRWGQLVYWNSDYNNSWDGGEWTEDTYYYILLLPNAEVIKGYVAIMR